MKRLIQHHFNYLRMQPEHVRLKTAATYSIVASIFVVLVWLVLLLPFQLVTKNSEKQKGGTVAGTISNSNSIKAPSDAYIPMEPSASVIPNDAILPTQSPDDQPSLPVTITQ